MWSLMQSLRESKCLGIRVRWNNVLPFMSYCAWSQSISGNNLFRRIFLFIYSGSTETVQKVIFWKHYITARRWSQIKGGAHVEKSFQPNIGKLFQRYQNWQHLLVNVDFPKITKGDFWIWCHPQYLCISSLFRLFAKWFLFRGILPIFIMANKRI